MKSKNQVTKEELKERVTQARQEVAEMFDVETKKQPQRNTKLLTISMPAADKQIFDEFCDENMTNKSKLISWLIQQHLGRINGDQEGLKK